MMSRLHGAVACDNQRIEDAASAIDLDVKFLARRVACYSKGSGQKLGIAAVLLSEQRLWVLDEPTSRLDPRARSCLKAQIVAPQRRGATVLFSSHSMADINERCHSFVVLHEGAIRFVGAAAELRSRTGEPTLDAAFPKVIE